MADAATIKTKVYEYVHIPSMEVVELTVTSGEEYRSTKFKTILGALVTHSEDNDGYTNVTFSGQVATIIGSFAGDTDMTLVLFGIK